MGVIGGGRQLSARQHEARAQVLCAPCCLGHALLQHGKHCQNGAGRACFCSCVPYTLHCFDTASTPRTSGLNKGPSELRARMRAPTSSPKGGEVVSRRCLPSFPPALQTYTMERGVCSSRVTWAAVAHTGTGRARACALCSACTDAACATQTHGTCPAYATRGLCAPRRKLALRTHKPCGSATCPAAASVTGPPSDWPRDCRQTCPTSWRGTASTSPTSLCMGLSC